ncbi:hypothetical protein B0H15DRAFT_863809 [Mycena belliarum]|uniref:Uncharacterized protein n=1 Tax=Mycena belliarum TaxID=1033014 RepID=A0AAD6XN95_9AGAR|nr:hypothetical protein B0H15DRAFT_863809 [Mycena belliae]
MVYYRTRRRASVASHTYRKGEGLYTSADPDSAAMLSTALDRARMSRLTDLRHAMVWPGCQSRPCMTLSLHPADTVSRTRYLEHSPHRTDSTRTPPRLRVPQHTVPMRRAHRTRDARRGGHGARPRRRLCGPERGARRHERGAMSREGARDANTAELALDLVDLARGAVGEGGVREGADGAWRADAWGHGEWAQAPRNGGGRGGRRRQPALGWNDGGLARWRCDDYSWRESYIFGLAEWLAPAQTGLFWLGLGFWWQPKPKPGRLACKPICRLGKPFRRLGTTQIKLLA